MFLVVGLGNPGKAYRNTRHNVGFMVLEKLAGQWNEKFKKEKRFSQVVKTLIDSHEVVLAKPVTYMNRSGIAVNDLVKRYHVDFSQLLVSCDDFNLPLGKIRLRKKGSHGGHNGLASIFDTLGTQEFPRLRLGIDLNPRVEPTEYVLSRFRASERPLLNAMIEKGTEVVTDFIHEGIERAMNFHN